MRKKQTIFSLKRRFYFILHSLGGKNKVLKTKSYKSLTKKHKRVALIPSLFKRSSIVKIKRGDKHKKN